MLFNIIVTAIAVSVDGMIVGFAYGMNKINLPFKSLLCSALTPACMVYITMRFSNFFAPFFSDTFVKIASFLLLIALASFSIYQYYISSQSGNHKTNALANPTLFDADNSKHISIKESLAIGATVGIDASASSITLALFGSAPFTTAILLGLAHFVLIGMGNLLGQKINLKTNFLRLLSAIIFISLAFTKLF